MTIQNKRDRITELIDNIKEHSDRLKDSQTLPLLELSVILSKITQLHEETLILKYLCADSQNYLEEEFGIVDSNKKELKDNEENLDEPTIEERAQLSENKSEKNQKDGIDSIIEATAEEVLEVEVSAEEEEILSVTNEEKQEQEVPLIQKSDRVEQVEEPLNEPALETAKVENAVDNDTTTFTGELNITVDEIESNVEMDAKPDLNEAFFEEEDASLSGQLQKQPIADLMTAIGLNERYLYANDLFEGDMEAFKSAVIKLNEAESGSVARSYFNNELRMLYNWKEDNELAKALFQLVERRYLN